MTHVIVYAEAGRFGGWPANHGIWRWGNETLVGFDRGYYKANLKGHSMDFDKPREMVRARSVDGGESWAVEPINDAWGISGKAGFDDVQDAAGTEPKPLEGLDFTHPDMAMKCHRSMLFVTYDRGRTWRGPYKLPDFGYKLTSRTDYLAQSKHECLFFFSAHEPQVAAGLQDRSFCAGTSDGGKTFQFLSWMTGEPLAARSVMSSTVRLAGGRLVAAMRRRLDVRQGDLLQQNNWIDVYESSNGGRQWAFLSKVADTDPEGHNGNPPAIVRLNDGRLCVAYGYRGTPCGIRAKLSGDGGRTWGQEIILRNDGRTWDLGYPRMVQRPDGKLVTVYYYTTDANPEQHIAATIWDPSTFKWLPGVHG